MCVINFEADVKNTKILAMSSTDGNRQFIAYSNDVATSIPNNAMILPVPYPETLQLHDLSAFSTLFDDCNSCFPQPQSAKNSYSDSAEMSLSANLKVHDVGSYQVSICNNINDFDRIDKNVFILNPVVKHILSKYYVGRKVPFGFIVCKLRSGDAEYHPLGYSHRIYSGKGYMFVPARHHHSGSSEEMESHWDHEIYSINTTEHAGQTGIYGRSRTVNKLSGLTGINFPEVHNIRRLILKGTIRNSDVFLAQQSVTQRKQFLGIDGCVFTSDEMHRFNFIPSLMGSMPTVQLGGKHYYFGFDSTSPLIFYGTRVNFEVKEGAGVKIIDEVGSPAERTYTFKLKNAVMAPDGKLFLTAS